MPRQPSKMKVKVNRITIELILGDLLNQFADAFVHVTDPNLSIEPDLVDQVGGAVLHQLEVIGWCEVGQCVVTDAGKLENFTKIIHAVAPRWGEGSERGKLANATWAMLNLAEVEKIRSVAVPAIAVGTLGYPVEGCAQIMIERIIDFTFESTKKLRHIKLCLLNPAIYDTFQRELNRQLDDLKRTGEGTIKA